MRTTLIATAATALVLQATSFLPGLAQSDDSSANVAQSDASNARVAHLLNRITFGPGPGDIDAVKRIGIDQFIKMQLHPDAIQEDPTVLKFVQSSPPLSETPQQLWQNYGPPAIRAAVQEQMAQGDQEETASKQDTGDGTNASTAKIAGNEAGQRQGAGDNKDAADKKDKKPEAKIRGQFYKDIYQSVTDAKMLRAVESPRQLEEVMTDFWFNHFNIFANKGLDHIWIGAYEEQAIRPYALGKFRDLVGATCHHAAMLFYLDNWQNSAPGTRNGKKESGLNENYARELMELHTLGVDGGYTQQDVIQLAHVLTGLGLPPRGRRANFDGNVNNFGSYFDARRHDGTDKVLLGHTIHGSGPGEIEEALDLLCSHPSTAHHISYELAQYFVCDNPPSSLVEKLSETFTNTGGDIRAVLNTLFHSDEFWDPQYAEAKYKSPFRFVVSSLRAVDAHPTNYRPLVQYLRQQGEPLYGCLTPDGYKNTKDAWLNPGALLKRIDFATMLASGRFKGIQPGVLDFRQVADATGDQFSDKTQDAIAKAPPQLKAALVLGSPEFMEY